MCKLVIFPMSWTVPTYERRNVKRTRRGIKISKEEKENGESGRTHMYLMDKFDKIDKNNGWDWVLY